MFFRKIVSEGLAHNSYVMGNKDEAFVVDPRRDIDTYIEVADGECCKLRFVFETHRNEDYLIGSRELENIAGCRIIHGRHLDFGYGEPAADGDVFNIGGLILRVLETPGHTPESLSFVLYQPENDTPIAVFTGDALFYGEVGRTDLWGDKMVSEFAQSLYDSLHKKLLPLGDHVIVYPAHGKGSACGGNISDLEMSTIGYEKATNPMLRHSRDEFIAWKETESLPLPPYFERMAELNLRAPELPEIKRIKPLDAPMFQDAAQDCVIIDTRIPVSFAGGHISGSYNIWLHGLPMFAGWMIEYDKDILLVTEREKEDVETARLYLARIGLDSIRGYLCGGITDWQVRGMPLEHTGLLAPSGVYERIIEKKDMLLLDVRDRNEYNTGHIPGAINMYVGELEKRLAELPSDKPVVAVCSTGKRSGLGASVLQRHGYKDVHNMIGGMTAWKGKGYQVSTG